MLTATVCVALSGAGIAVSLLTAWRRKFRRAVRLAAVSLLPVGLYLAGLITLGRRIGVAVGSWAADLVLKPTVWIGFAVVAVAVVLYLASRIGAKRGGGREQERPAARGRADGPAVAPAASRSAIPGAAPAATTGAPAATGTAARGKGGKEPASDFEDIEAILRKHGI